MDKIYRQELEIGEWCENCYRLLGGVIRSDSDIYKKYIKPGED